MKLFTLLMFALLAAIGLFASLNWSSFIVPANLTLGFMEIHVPLGLLMLALLACVTILFLVYVLYMQTSSLIENRRLSRKLESNIALAEKAEVSRFTELKTLIEAAMLKQTNSNAEAKTSILARVEQLSKELHATIDQSGNTIAAHIGEFEDRFEKSKHP